MSDAYESIALLVQTLRNQLTTDPALNAVSLRDHKSLLRFVEQGDVSKAAALLRRHIAKTPSDYAERLAIDDVSDRRLA
jgi:DNA-binding GntR family transcriptional regulator